MAAAAELDLVELSPPPNRPGGANHGLREKFLFEQNKKAHSAKRKQKQIQVKEVKISARHGRGGLPDQTRI